MRKLWLYTSIVFCSCMICFAQAGISQAVHFTTQIRSSKVGVNEPFQVQFILENAGNISGFSPPSFNGFNVLQNFQSQQMTMVNGQTSQSFTVTYVLQATAAGKFTIQGATATVNGNTIRSNPVTVEVDKEMAGNNNNNSNPSPNTNIPVPRGFSPPGTDDDIRGLPGVLKKGEDPMQKIKKNLFVKVDVDKTDVYQGQQVTATYKLYTRLQTSSKVTKVPAFSGFSTEDIVMPNPPQATIERINGVAYKMFIIRKTALFPLQSGNLQLDPVEVQNSVRLYTVNPSRHRQSNDPFDNFFRDPFGDDPFDDAFGDNNISYQDYDYNLKSAPITIHVKPLPSEGQPAGFNGAVGKFIVKASVDKTQFTTDDAGTLKVTVSGAGNINLLNAPAVSFPTDFDSYDPRTTDHFNKNALPFSGSRTFEYVFMPRSAGDYTISPVVFSYFNPETGSYETARTDSFNLHITPGKNHHAASNAVDYSTAGNQLAPIQRGNLTWSRGNMLLVTQWWYWCFLLLPLIAVLIWITFRQREARLQSNQVLLKNRRANKVALKRLSAAAKYLQQRNEKLFYEETSHAVWGYLSHKLNIPFAELGKEKVQQKLQERDIPDADIDTLFRLLDECEQALYAPPGSHAQMQLTYEEGVQVISRLEDKLKG